MGSELDRPLGQDRKEGHGKRRWPRVGSGAIAGGACAVALVAGSFYTALAPQNIGSGNLPAIAPKKAAVLAAAPVSKPNSATVATPVSSPSTSSDMSSSPRAGAVAPQGGFSGATTTSTVSPDGVTITTIGPAKRTGNGPAWIEVGSPSREDPHLSSQPDPSLVEDTEYGKLPIRSKTGKRPMDAYARPAASGGIRVAIVVGGLGLSQSSTLSAIDNLPPGVTLAFAATGNSLDRWMQLARHKGHEILLQVPMEPFDYPQTDPGPHTLTVGEGAAKELANLHYAMGRLTNYTGIMNYMGGRFMADGNAMEPVMRDVGKRGLLFLDDGSSAQSLAGKLARPLHVPFARAAVQLDSDSKPGEVVKKLNALEQTARSNGSAIGVASAFDDSIDAIAAWAKEAKARGIKIVGVSALVDDPGNKDQ